MRTIYKGTLLFLGWLLLAIIPLSKAQAQKESANWHFGNQAAVSFSSGSPVAVAGSGMTSYEGCASISSSNGQLLLYSNGEQVWDANHQVMPNGSSLGGHNSASQGALLLRAPGSSLYYLFTVDAIDNNLVGGLRYSIIDMSLRGGLGDVTATKSVRLPTPTLTGKVTEKLTAALHANGRDYWVVVHGWQNNSFYSFLLSSSGLSTTPVTSAVGPVHTGGGSFFGAANAVGCIRISPNGTKLALAQRDTQFELYDFNNATGQLSNYLSLRGDNTYYYGVEFSPDNSRLYTAMYSDGGFDTSIYQYNLLAGSGTAIQNSQRLIGAVNGLSVALQAAPNDKIYLSALNKAYLNVIDKPNLLGTAAAFRENAVSLGTRLAQNGLPNFPNAFALTPNDWTGAVSTDYLTPANWSAGYVPGSTDDVTIKATALRMPVLSGRAAARSFAVEEAAAMTVDGTLLLGGDLLNNGAFSGEGELQMVGTTAHAINGRSTSSVRNLTLATGSPTTLNVAFVVSGVLTLNANLNTPLAAVVLASRPSGTAMVVNNGSFVVVGRAVMQRYIAPGLNAGVGYRHYASPVSNATLATLRTDGFAPTFNESYNAAPNPGAVTPFPTVFGYDQQRLATAATATNTGFNAGWYSPAGASSSMSPGLGYTVNLDAANLVEFDGTLNNGPITRGSLTRTPDADGGWHLLGNPYPAPLDWNLAVAGTTNLLSSVYVFKSAGQYDGSYASYVNGVGAARYIAAGQGFFVRVSAASLTGSLSFTNAARLTSYLNPEFNRGTTTETRPLVQLDLVRGAQRDAAYVYFESGATAGFDAAFDAYKITTGEVPALSVQAERELLSISGLPNTLTVGRTTAPLIVYTPQAGTYTLEAAQLLNLPAGTAAYLHDAQTGALINLRQQSAYTFTAAAGQVSSARFALVVGPSQVLTSAAAHLSQEVALFPNPAQRQVALSLPAALSQQPIVVTLVNALGQQVLRQRLTASGAPVVLPLAGVAKGVYTVHISSAAGVVSKKLVVE